MIESIIVFMQESFRNNIILIAVLTTLCVIVDYLRNIQKRKRLNIIEYKQNKDIIRII